jgi:hypothetical protein
LDLIFESCKENFFYLIITTTCQIVFPKKHEQSKSGGVAVSKPEMYFVMMTFEFSRQKWAATFDVIIIKSVNNKTENHFSHYPRSLVDINSYTRLKIAMSLIAGKA